MMRKKKRQSEREAEIAQRNQLPLGTKEEAEVDSVPKRSEGEKIVFRCQSEDQSQENADVAKGGLDLNCCPSREQTEEPSSRVSMMSLVQEASLPLDTYLKQNGLTSLISEQQGTSGNQENTAQTQDDRGFSALVQEHEGSNEFSEKDQMETDQA